MISRIIGFSSVTLIIIIILMIYVVINLFYLCCQTITIIKIISLTPRKRKMTIMTMSDLSEMGRHEIKQSLVRWSGQF